MDVNDRQVGGGDPALALAAVLRELASLLERVSDVDYASRPRATVSGSIGAHVRHCVDHVQIVLDRCADGVVSFDERRRGTLVEHSRAAGLSVLRRCVERLESERLPAIDASLAMEARLGHGAARVRVESSVGRELVYVLQHTIHHNALIAVLLAFRGADVPERFGYAPSTPIVNRHESIAAACAR